MRAAPMALVETPFYLRKAASLLDEEERSELVVFLGMNPEAGGIIPETGGVRKLRWAAYGRGKRGGFPASKNQKANLTKAERNEFKKLVPILVKTYAKGRKP